MTDRLMGQLLIRRGAMSQAQVDRVLERQSQVHQPFGKLAVQMFSISERDIAFAWADQVGKLCRKVDLPCEPNDPAVLKLLSAREAWRHKAMPLRVELGTLLVATTITELPEVSLLLHQRTELPVEFVLCEVRQLEQFIMRRYEVADLVAV